MSLSDAFGAGGFDIFDDEPSESSLYSGNSDAAGAAMDAARRSTRLNGRARTAAADV
jgi:hypothetical protein